MPSAAAQAEHVSEVDRARVEEFIFHEARLQDEHRYDEWEALWEDDALYWVPIEDDADPSRRVSYIYDNRARLASRIRQLKTGRRHSQAPRSRMRRVISNIEITSEPGCVKVISNFILVESRRGAMVTWAGQTSHDLRLTENGFRMAAKTVRLVNNGEAMPNLAFLI